MTWDVVVVGAGPAGSAAALGALTADPTLGVLLLDREDFPRDKPCGDGIAPHALDVLERVGVTGLLADRVPVRRLVLRAAPAEAAREMARDAYVVPRTVLDARLVEAATAAGAELVRRRVRAVRPEPGEVRVDDVLAARVLVGADGAHSLVRRAAGLPPAAPRALALRGYAPTPPGRRGQQVIAFGRDRQPSYAWSFDTGDGVANVGYGELLRTGQQPPSRRLMLERLEDLLPGATAGAARFRGHHLPLSSWRWPHPDGPVLLAGDAAGLVNPLSGEGIYYAVATGVLAGRSAAAALAAGDAAGAGARYRRAVRSLLAGHLASTSALAALSRRPGVVRAAVRAAAADQAVFDGLVELGLGAGRLPARVLRSAAGQLSGCCRSGRHPSGDLAGFRP